MDALKKEKRKQVEKQLGIHFLTVDVLAGKIKMSREFLIEAIHMGKIPAYQPGRNYLIREDDVWVYLLKEKREERKEEQEPETLRFNELELFTLAEVMLFLRVGRPTLMEAITSGVLPAYKPGNEYLIKRTDLLAYLETFRVQERK